MNNICLSKSKYCNCIQCKKISWLKKYKPEVAIKSEKDEVYKNGKEVGKLAKKLFGEYEDIEFNENQNVMIEKTKELLDKGANVIAEASFVFNNNFCSIDILKNDVNKLEIYEVKSSVDMRDIYIDDLAYQYYILSKLGYNIKKASIIHLNREYIREKNLNLNQLFVIEDLTDKVIEMQNKVEENIKVIKDYMGQFNDENEPNIDISLNCLEPYRCEFWDYCTKALPKPNVFDLSILGNKSKKIKFEKYYEGKISFEDLQYEDLQERALEQISFELNNLPPKIDKEAIKELLNSLKYPLYFIDYESYQAAIPDVIGTKPYQQLPFQYSLHIIRKKGDALEHKEFLAKIDDKDFIRHFAESMIKDISEDGSVIVYNKGFEAARNNEIANMYPDLKKELERINNNIVDFLVPFRQRKYYMKEMHGSASIKSVLPALYPNDPELDYHNLPVVHNGKEASETFLNLQDKTEEEQEKIRKGLLVYCELDTYAMVKIWEKFNEIVGDE